MIALPMVMLNKFVHGTSEVALADRNDPIEALLFDRAHEPFGVGTRTGRLIRCLHDVDQSAAPRTVGRHSTSSCGPLGADGSMSWSCGASIRSAATSGI